VNWRRLFGSLAVAAVVAISALSAAAQSLPPGVADCLAAIAQQSDSAANGAPEDGGAKPETPRLGDVCPDVAAAIDDGPWGEAIAFFWADQMSTRAFRELTGVVSTYEPAAAGEIDLPRESLDESLAELCVQKKVSLDEAKLNAESPTELEALVLRGGR